MMAMKLGTALCNRQKGVRRTPCALEEVDGACGLAYPVVSCILLHLEEIHKARQSYLLPFPNMGIPFLYS